MLVFFALPSTAQAIVGGAAPAIGGDARAVVTIVGSRGSFCSGVLLAPTIVLTAAHCVQPGADYKIVDYDAERQPKLRDVKKLAINPTYARGALASHRASADLALLQLAEPLLAQPLPFGVPTLPLVPGRAFRIVGIGVSTRSDGKSGGTARSATLAVTSQPSTLQIRLVDPATNNLSPGLGACTGDSGAPVLEDQKGRTVIVGVVSWSTAANNAEGCGGLTGVTPLTIYKEWVSKTVTNWLQNRM